MPILFEVSSSYIFEDKMCLCAYVVCAYFLLKSPELEEKIKSVDAITYTCYCTVCPFTVKIEGEFIFDIKLPSDYVPINQDKEVECFYLMNINQV